MPTAFVVEVMENRTGAIDRNYSATYTRTWDVHTSAPTVGGKKAVDSIPVAIGNSFDCGDGFPDTGSFCSAIDALADPEDPLKWRVTANYTPGTPGNVNPLLNPIEASWDSESFEEIVDQDASGNAIVNSAGDYFDPPVTEEGKRPVLTVVRNEATYDAGLSFAIQGCTNSDVVLTVWAVGTVKLAERTGRLAVAPSGSTYWIVTYKFIFNPATWIKKILDQGVRELVSGDRKQIFIDGVPAATPVLLDGSGAPLTPGGTPNFISFTTRGTFVFASLGFTIPA